MKASTSILLLSLTVTACSPENVPTEKQPVDMHAYRTNLSGIPSNTANAKDYAGAIYQRILDAHYAASTNPISLEQLISRGESLAFLNPDFQALSEMQPYYFLSVSEIAPYIGLSNPDINSQLSSSYSPGAKAYYSEIVSGLAELKRRDATYDEAYSCLTGIEGAVVADAAIPQNQSQAILVTASILRYGLHHDRKRKRRDRDWDWMTGNIAATANAALDSEVQAIVVSFVTDVYEN